MAAHAKIVGEGVLVGGLRVWFERMSVSKGVGVVGVVGAA